MAVCNNNYNGPKCTAYLSRVGDAWLAEFYRKILLQYFMAKCQTVVLHVWKIFGLWDPDCLECRTPSTTDLALTRLTRSQYFSEVNIIQKLHFIIIYWIRTKQHNKKAVKNNRHTILQIKELKTYRLFKRAPDGKLNTVCCCIRSTKFIMAAKRKMFIHSQTSQKLQQNTWSGL